MNGVATYDSTEHFWQAVKYHPDVTLADLAELVGMLQQRDWSSWLARLDGDPKVYLPNAYAVEFLRHNLARERLQWFRDELGRHGLTASDHARVVQQHRRRLRRLRLAAWPQHRKPRLIPAWWRQTRDKWNRLS